VEAGPPADMLGVTPVDVARAAGYPALAEQLHQHFKNCGGSEQKQNGSGGEHKEEA